MEFLGYTFDNPSRQKNGKWKFVEIEYEDSNDFNHATSKVLRTIGREDSDGKCIVTNKSGEKFILEIVHATYDTILNIIRIFPYDCRRLTN